MPTDASADAIDAVDNQSFVEETEGSKDRKKKQSLKPTPLSAREVTGFKGDIAPSPQHQNVCSVIIRVVKNDAMDFCFVATFSYKIFKLYHMKW